MLFFNATGFKMNKSKSAINGKACESEATLLEGKDSYKYLGIIETASITISKDSFEILKSKILKRIN